MAISSVTSGLPSALTDALKRNVAAQQRGASMPVAGPQPVTNSFAGALDSALKNVSAAQNNASQMADAFQSDPASVSLEQAMVAMQKSQIGFQSALHVRNRLVSAYSDIMNMQV